MPGGGNTHNEFRRVALSDVAAGFPPCPSPHWPFRYFADPRQPVEGNGLALARP